jgi:hexosaminidase
LEPACEHELGRIPADSAFAVDFQLAQGRNAALQSGAGALTLVNQTGFGKIRFTLDGAEPSQQSELYSAPLALELGALIKATAFSNDGRPLAAARTCNFSADTLLTRSSNQLQVCERDSLRLRLPLTPNSPAIAPVYNVDLFHSCYLYAKAPLTDVTALRFDRQRLEIPIAPRRGEHDMCFIFSASTSGPLYAIGDVKLLRR